MDELPYRYDASKTDWTAIPEPAPCLRVLCACALTCRAWRIRAQRLLWISPRLVDRPHIALFTKNLRTAPIRLVTTLAFEHRGHHRSGELFMHAFPNLRLLSYRKVDFECGPPLAFFRLRLPFH